MSWRCATVTCVTRPRQCIQIDGWMSGPVELQADKREDTRYPASLVCTPRHMRFRTFQFHGPNWLTDFAGCEWLVWLSRVEREALLESAQTMQADLVDLLEKNGIEPRHLEGLHRPLPKNPRSRFAFLLNSTAIALQRHAGHKVSRARRLVRREQAWVRAVFETEDAVAGRSAGRISLYLLQQVFPELKLTAEWTRNTKPVSVMIDKFRARFSAATMPLETRSLIRGRTAG